MQTALVKDLSGYDTEGFPEQAMKWAGFGRFLLSLPQRFAVQPIDSLHSRALRSEWLFRPPAGMSAERVFRALAPDPDLGNVELAVVGRALEWSAFHGPVSINLTPISLGQSGFAARLFDLISVANAYDVWWEVTEIWPVNHVTTVGRNLLRLRELGGKIAIDDIDSLQRLEDWVDCFGPPDIVKIDKSVTQNAMTDNDPGLLHRLVYASKSHGCEVVVEGIESESQLAMADAVNADYWQGYYGSEPQPVEEFEVAVA